MQLLVCSLLFLTATTIQAAKWSEPVPINPNFPSKCYDHANKKYYSVGARWNRKGECTRYTCDVDSTTVYVMIINGESCNYAHDFPSHCHLTVPNRSTAFPKCCPKVKCNKPPATPNGAPLPLSPLSPQAPLSPPLQPVFAPPQPVFVQQVQPVFAPPLQPVFAVPKSIGRRNRGE